MITSPSESLNRSIARSIPLTNTHIQTVFRSTSHHNYSHNHNNQSPSSLSPRRQQLSKLIQQDRKQRLEAFKNMLATRMHDRDMNKRQELLGKRFKVQSIRDTYMTGVMNSRRMDFQRKIREAQHIRERLMRERDRTKKVVLPVPGKIKYQKPKLCIPSQIYMLSKTEVFEQDETPPVGNWLHNYKKARKQPRLKMFDSIASS